MRPVNFMSDNVAGADPAVLAAMERANLGDANPYGEDDLSRDVENRISGLFEAETKVFLVSTGTAANALGLAALVPPFGAALCHVDSHVWRDECGAPEFYSGGAKLVALPGGAGKLHAADLDAYLAVPGHGVHQSPPAAVSLSQLSECGTVYSLAETAAIAGLAHACGLKVHMDGARFANALVTLGCTPADATWRAGIDVLSFGASKNGAVSAEAVVVFDGPVAASLGYRRKRGGHLLAKMRFVAAQFDAYLRDDLWLRNAAHANGMARRLAHGIDGVPGVRFHYPVEGNEVFVGLPEATIESLNSNGYRFHRWAGEVGLIRLVTSFRTAAEDVDAFIAAVARMAGRSAAAAP